MSVRESINKGIKGKESNKQIVQNLNISFESYDNYETSRKITSDAVKKCKELKEVNTYQIKNVQLLKRQGEELETKLKMMSNNLVELLNLLKSQQHNQQSYEYYIQQFQKEKKPGQENNGQNVDDQAMQSINFHMQQQIQKLNETYEEVDKYLLEMEDEHKEIDNQIGKLKKQYRSCNQQHQLNLEVLEEECPSQKSLEKKVQELQNKAEQYYERIISLSDVISKYEIEKQKNSQLILLLKEKEQIIKRLNKDLQKYANSKINEKIKQTDQSTQGAQQNMNRAYSDKSLLDHLNNNTTQNLKSSTKIQQAEEKGKVSSKISPQSEQESSKKKIKQQEKEIKELKSHIQALQKKVYEQEFQLQAQISQRNSLKSHKEVSSIQNLNDLQKKCNQLQETLE